jgi:hypothetical protein
MSFNVPGAISSCRGIVIVCSPAGVLHVSWAWLPRCRIRLYPNREKILMRFFSLATGSPGNSTYLGLRQREDTDTLPFAQFFFKVEPNGFTDIYHQLVESFPLREDIDTDAPAAPVSAIRINFKFDEHGSTSVIC